METRSYHSSVSFSILDLVSFLKPVYLFCHIPHRFSLNSLVFWYSTTVIISVIPDMLANVILTRETKFAKYCWRWWIQPCRCQTYLALSDLPELWFSQTNHFKKIEILNTCLFKQENRYCEKCSHQRNIRFIFREKKIIPKIGRVHQFSIAAFHLYQTSPKCEC